MNLQSYMPHIKETAIFFAFTMVEMAILFVGISFLVGVINEFLPQDKVKSWLSGRKGRGYIIGSILGGLTPFCSCSTIPVTVGLLRAQAGFGPTMAFLFTSPLVNPIIIPLFLTLIGVKITIVYGLVAIGMSIGISYLLEKAGFVRFVKKEVLAGFAGHNGGQSENVSVSELGSVPCCDKQQEKQQQPAQIMPMHSEATASCCPTSSSVVSGGAPPTFLPLQMAGPSRWERIFKEAVDQFRKLLPFIILGVAIGSLIHGFLPTDFVVRVAGENNPLAIPVAAVAGIPLYLRVSTMVPIAATLIAKGMSVGAVVALIIGGAGASLPEMAMLKGIFKMQLLLAFIASVMVMAVSAGFIINML